MVDVSNVEVKKRHLGELSPRGVMGTVADGIAILSVLGGGVALAVGGGVAQAVLAISLASLAVVFIAISFRLHGELVRDDQSHRRLQQNVTATAVLSEATAHAARATVVAATQPREFLLHLDNACSSLAKMYSLASGSVCRVTVLETYAPTAQHRPGEAATEREANGVAVRLLSASYSDRPIRSSIDWVVDNTDFDSIFGGGQPYFLCNDLPAEVSKGLRDSHWPRERIAEFRANDSWPRRSAIVWPIGSTGTSSADAERALVGFLCVDSEDLGTFSKDFDVPTGETFAHAMYSGMATYRAAQQGAAQPTKPEGSDR